MSENTPPPDSTYIARLWEYPTLCLAFFGVQFLTEEGRALYEQSGINAEIPASLESGPNEGLLLTRPLMTPEGPVLMQYWRSYEDLDRYARTLPHTKWWKWLVQNKGKGVAFYHEIYPVRAAEAIYEPGTIPVGPAVFCTLEAVRSGEGQSRARQQRFIEAAHATEAPDSD